ncbi:MAG: DUF4294 domain-containing protein [Bacteroidales bacterium]|jgi:hypothetical protein|nr:DUF4294 domain-containing protein [Bacteroidales bacterium]MCB9028246.1 DUF4294 domain-containing protein [Bacteroidales bacterium]MDD3736093.1 DUF4294 domain-containing protein [Bacteroidales bacterium]NLD64487.1 DUF4294 domain-containing protein [Bacteroidales bacterium]HNT93807.1 DUF4294 domain-containing protein [Bacteroidales bacterium]
MRRVAVILLLFIPSVFIYGQEKDPVQADTVLQLLHVLKTATFDGQTYPLVELKEVTVIGKMPRGVRFDYRRHARLVYNVRRVYPYALLVRDEFGRINRTLEILPSERARRNFLQQYEKDLFSRYEGDMRKLTFTQGKILIKLIDRETQNTSYDLIRDYRGKFSATFWQGIARIFGANLKSTYDADGDDYLIEQVVREIEAGRL